MVLNTAVTVPVNTLSSRARARLDLPTPWMWGQLATAVRSAVDAIYFLLQTYAPYSMQHQFLLISHILDTYFAVLFFYPLTIFPSTSFYLPSFSYHPPSLIYLPIHFPPPFSLFPVSLFLPPPSQIICVKLGNSETGLWWTNRENLTEVSKLCCYSLSDWLDEPPEWSECLPLTQIYD